MTLLPPNFPKIGLSQFRPFDTSQLQLKSLSKYPWPLAGGADHQLWQALTKFGTMSRWVSSQERFPARKDFLVILWAAGENQGLRIRQEVRNRWGLLLLRIKGDIILI